MIKVDFKDPGVLYESSMADITDLYEIRSGPNALREDVIEGTTLRQIEVSPMAKPRVGDISNLRDCDPQEPLLLTYEDLATKALSFSITMERIEKERTEEFEAITNAHQVVPRQ